MHQISAVLVTGVMYLLAGKVHSLYVAPLIMKFYPSPFLSVAEKITLRFSDVRAVYANHHPLQEGSGSSEWRQNGGRTRRRCDRHAGSS